MPSRRHFCRSKAFVATALILSISSIAVVLGAPAPPVRTESTTGESLVILRRNELDTSHTFESMLLLSEPRTLAEGKKACLEFGEGNYFLYIIPKPNGMVCLRTTKRVVKNVLLTTNAIEIY